LPRLCGRDPGKRARNSEGQRVRSALPVWRVGGALTPRDAAPEKAYDAAERRQAAEQEMKGAGVPDQARQAKLTADHLNGQDPRPASRIGKGRPAK
jgi:hypothetical protein